MSYALAKSILFALEPERAHRLSVRAMAAVGAFAPFYELLRQIYASPRDPVRAFGLNFANRVGVAAGYDKDAQAYRGLSSLGFGHVEVGTVTPRPQQGNPTPRTFRLTQDEAVINRLGFPSDGAQVVARRLEGPRPDGLILGVNIGKQKETPLEEALLDYQPLVGLFASLCDYIVVNVSSPNTPGLRKLQTRDYLEALLRGVNHSRMRQVEVLGRPVPLLVKFSPDLSNAQLEEAVGVTMDCGLDGIIATNTTVSREGLTSAHASETGGLSGRPLTARALEVVELIARLSDGRLPIVAVGGIMNGDDAKARIDAGATLVQIYTGMIYRGPRLGKEINRALLR